MTSCLTNRTSEKPCRIIVSYGEIRGVFGVIRGVFGVILGGFPLGILFPQYFWNISYHTRQERHRIWRVGELGRLTHPPYIIKLQEEIIKYEKC